MKPQSARALQLLSFRRLVLMAGSGLFAAVSTWAQPGTITLVPIGTAWRYLDTGTDQGSAWQQTNFNDSGWASGPTQLGFGDGDEAQIINGGPSGSRYPTTYFR